MASSALAEIFPETAAREETVIPADWDARMIQTAVYIKWLADAWNVDVKLLIAAVKLAGVGGGLTKPSTTPTV